MQIPELVLKCTLFSHSGQIDTKLKTQKGLRFIGGQEWRDGRDAHSFMHRLMYTDEQGKDIISITQEVMNISKKNIKRDKVAHTFGALITLWSMV